MEWIEWENHKCVLWTQLGWIQHRWFNGSLLPERHEAFLCPYCFSRHSLTFNTCFDLCRVTGTTVSYPRGEGRGASRRLPVRHKAAHRSRQPRPTGQFRSPTDVCEATGSTWTATRKHRLLLLVVHTTIQPYYLSYKYKKSVKFKLHQRKTHKNIQNFPKKLKNQQMQMKNVRWAVI